MHCIHVAVREVPRVRQEECKLSWRTNRKLAVGFRFGPGGGKKKFLNLQVDLIRGCSSCVEAGGQRVKS